MNEIYTKYIIALALKQQTRAEMESLWSTLMEANVDCVMDASRILEQNDTQYRIHHIYFKTISERELAMTILKIVE